MDEFFCSKYHKPKKRITSSLVLRRRNDQREDELYAANLLRRAAVVPREGQRRTAGGRRWLRAYLNGCAFKVFDSRLSASLAKVPFAEAAEWLYRTSGFVLMGTSRFLPSDSGAI